MPGPGVGNIPADLKKHSFQAFRLSGFQFDVSLIGSIQYDSMKKLELLHGESSKVGTSLGPRHVCTAVQCPP